MRNGSPAVIGLLVLLLSSGCYRRPSEPLPDPDPGHPFYFRTPVRCLTFSADPGVLFVGTEFPVLYAANTNGSWYGVINGFRGPIWDAHAVAGGEWIVAKGDVFAETKDYTCFVPAKAIRKTPQRGVEPMRSAGVWDLEQIGSAYTFITKDGPDPISSSGDGKIVATTEQEEVLVWQLDPRPRRVFSFATYKYWCVDLAMTPDGTRLVTSGYDARPPTEAGLSVRLWDIRKGQLIKEISRIHNDWAAISLASDGRRLVIGRADDDRDESGSGAVEVWKLSSVGASLQFMRSVPGIRCLALSPDGSVLAIAAGSTVTLRRMSDWSFIHRYGGHSDHIRCVAFSPDGRWMASGGEDGVVKIRDLSAVHQLGGSR